MTRSVVDLQDEIDIAKGGSLKRQMAMDALEHKLIQDKENRVVQLFLDGTSVDSLVNRGNSVNFVNCAIRKALRKAMDSANL